MALSDRVSRSSSPPRGGVGNRRTVPSPAPVAGKPTLKQKAAQEMRRFLVMAAYLWVLLALFSLHQSIVLAEHGINFREQGFAIVNALMLAKVMLIAEGFHVGRRFENRPLVYPILYQSIEFAILFICFHIVEHLAVGWWEGKTMAASFPEIGGGSPKGIASAGVILFVMLIPFFAFKELGRIVGDRELHALVFGLKKPNRSVR
ncbi:hypothetical protein [Methylocapsa palsarum]|uniref:Uncharacterized protein n=1 Tax=Methylocapsa palsarum TaxID=1612308 RepID=A0A1I4AHB3_9HYPH|nr:hypothetical protein [Methylocapsa palsarum]SFK55407.1 hypothetical protein SAMN05444581_11083 [Methylocapsa palsarum]